MLTISSMVCQNCALCLESIEDEMKSILMAEASFHKAQMVVA